MDEHSESENWELNEHWKVIAGGGRVISTTPKQLWEQAVEYFKWNDANPMTAKRTLQSGKEAGKKVDLEFKRPYSIKAFCLHASVSERYLMDIKDSKETKSEWYDVVEKILMIIYTQNLEGAMVDIYNPIMVSKVLNMDKGASDESSSVVRVEIVQSQSNELAHSENEILEKLDFGKREILKEKTENYQR